MYLGGIELLGEAQDAYPLNFRRQYQFAHIYTSFGWLAAFENALT
jgi:hypothetical protein